MAIIKKYFSGGLNSDTDPALIQEGDYMNALNIRVGAGDDGSTEVLRPVPGHTKVYTIADNKGSSSIATTSTEDVKYMVVDEENGYIYSFKSGYVTDPPPFPGDPAVITFYPQIVRSNLDGTGSTVVFNGRELSQNWAPADDTTWLWDDLVQAEVVGPNLIWINKFGHQFSLNVTAWLNDGGSEDLTKPHFIKQDAGRDEVSLIKRSPAIEPFVQKIQGTDPERSLINFIKRDVLQFSYRYIYAGYEISVPSPWSKELPMNSETDDDLGHNAVRVIIPAQEYIPRNVISVEVMCKNNATGSINIVKRWSSLVQSERAEILSHIDELSQLEFEFYNDSVFESVDNAYYAKQFDSVPVESYSIEVAKNRLFLANNKEGYNTPQSNSLSVSTASEAPSNSDVLDVLTIKLGFDVVAVDDNDVDADSDRGERVEVPYEYSAYAVYLDAVDNPGYYELYANGGRASNNDFEITLASSDECTLESTTTNLSTFLSNVDFIHLSGFANVANNGAYTVKSSVSGSGPWTVDLRKTIPATLVNENSAGSLTITAVAMSSIVDTPTASPIVSASAGPIDYETIGPVFFRGATLTDYWNNIRSLINAHLKNDVVDLSGYIIRGAGALTSSSSTDTTSNITINNIGDADQKSFKSDSRYVVGIQFYDWAMRKPGVFTSPSMVIDIPDRDYSNTELSKYITWTLPSGTQTEIPSWAKYYSIVRSDNLDTRYFIQGQVANATPIEICYAKKDTDGVWDIDVTNLTYTGDDAGIAIDLEDIISKGFGYIYEEGDIIKLYKSTGEKFSARVITTSGRFLITSLVDLGNLATTTWRFEIRRPYKSLLQEPFYETSIHRISNWGTSTRAYSQLTGTIQGDIQISNSLEYMNLNEEFRNVWVRNLGRPCFIDTTGQVVNKTGIRWSNTFIPGTAVNGVSTFDAIDFENLPVELGPVNKLQLTSKAQADGTVMLAIGQNLTASMYLGETQLMDNTGQSFVATSGKVIGTVNVLKGMFGTTVPTSVVEVDGNVFWLDLLHECVVRYSSNGLFPISELGMRNFWRSYCKLKKTEVNELDITQSPVAYGGYNPGTNEYMLSFASCTEAADSYPDSSATRFHDIRMMYRTGTPARSVGFSIDNERWTSFYTHGGPYVYHGGRMYNFMRSEYHINIMGARRSGGLFIFNKDSSTNAFYLQNRDSFIAYPVNEAPNNIKIFHAFSIEGDRAPSTTYLETRHPNNQITNMVTADCELKEGVYYAPIYRDRISPNVSGSNDEKMFTGDKMRGNVGFFTNYFTTPSAFTIRFINVNVKNSSGHKLQ